MFSRLKQVMGPPDWILLGTTMALIGLGLMMVYSSSADLGYREYDDAAYFFKRQLAWLGIGLVAMFLTPLYEVIPLEAVAPALVVVGAMMIGQLTTVDFKRLDYALPAFLTVVTMPFTYSIANGIGIGFISWVVMATAAGKARTVHPLLWFVAAIFVAYFARGPISDLIG